jgi:probable ATP-dependent RNA helicase DDX4
VGAERTLVFVEKKRTADFLATILSNEGLPTTSIHGDRGQRSRDEALNDFKSGKRSILVATAVELPLVEGVAHVVNYDLPSNIDEFIHRIWHTGRCGCCNRVGKVTSFYQP